MTAFLGPSVRPESEATLWQLRGLQAMVTCRIEWLAEGALLEIARAGRLLARESWPDVETAMHRASVIREALMLLGWTDQETA